MSGNVLTYSPSDVKLFISGFTCSGLVRCTLTWGTQAFTTVKGIRGRNTRIRQLDTSATLEVEVLQTSDTNDVFSQIVYLDRQNGSACLTLTLSDISGRTMVVSDEAYIAGNPTIAYSNNFDTRVWTFELASVRDIALTGAPDDGGGLLDSISRGVSSITSLF